MKTQKPEMVSGSSKATIQPKLERTNPESGAHGVTLTETKTVRKRTGSNSDITTGVYLTVRISNSSLTKKHFRLILDTLLFEIVRDGIDLYQYLMMEHLMSLLLGPKLKPLDLLNEHERRVSLISMILMRDLRGLDFGLENGPKRFLSKDLVETLSSSDLLMSERTYNSRKSLWKPERYLSIQTVLIDTLIERSGKTVRYSSYCKGYGESHPSSHKQKVRPSAELDGKDLGDPEDFSLQEILRLLVLNQLELITMSRKKRI